MVDRLVPIDTDRTSGDQFPDLVQDEIEAVVAKTAEGVIDADLAARSIGFVDEGGGEGYFTVGGVPVSGTLVPPAATWTGVAGKPFTDVKDHGAVGDGVTDDTAAIEAALAVVHGPDEHDGQLFFPPGTYVYNGTGLDAASGSVRIVGAGRVHTDIVLGASSYLLDVPGVLSRLILRDMTIRGGKGAIRHTRTDANVVEHLLVENVKFKDYTECAVASDSSDMPYWQFRSCMFDSANTTDTIGVALSGLTDSCVIENCSFVRNRVHVKIRRGGNNMYISKSDFIFFSDVNSGGPRAAVWVVPHTSTTNAGPGFTVRSCKFGNENLVAGDFRLLYADEGAGATNGVKMPELGADSTGYIIGHRVSDSAFYSIGADTPSIVYSTTPNVYSCAISDNYIQRAKYLLEYRTPTSTPDRFDSTNVFGPNATYANAEGTVIPASNAVGAGYGNDPAGMFLTSESTGVGAASPASYASLVSTPIGSYTIVASRWTKDADITDAFGGTEAATFTASHADAQLYTSVAAMTPGVPVWVEFDIANPNDGNALDQLRVYVQDGGSSFHWRRSVPMPTVAQGWVTYAFSFIPRTAGTSANIVFSNSDTTESKSVSLGRVRVYHGTDRQIGGKRPAVTGIASLQDELVNLGLITGAAPPAPVSESLNFASIAAQSYEDLTMTVTGAVTTDCVALGIGPGAASTANVAFTAWVSAADTVTVRAHNYSSGARDPVAGTFKVAIIR